MFTNLFLGEIKKSFGKILHIVFVLIIALVIIVVSVNIHKQHVEMKKYAEEMEWEDFSNAVEYSREEIDALIAGSRLQVELAENEKEKAKFRYYQASYDSLYLAKATLKYYEYIRDNELYNQPITQNEGLEAGYLIIIYNGITADYFVVQIMSILSAIILIYGIIIASGIYAKEHKDGTLKILFIRPMTRVKLILAKALAVLTMVSVAYVIPFIITTIIGYSLFPPNDANTVFSFGGGAFSLMRGDFIVFIAFLTQYIELISMVFISFFMSVLIRSRVWAIVIPFLLNSFGALVVFTGLSRFFIMDAMNFSQYVGVSEMVTGGANVWLSIAIYILYMGGLSLLTHFITQKRDLA